MAGALSPQVLKKERLVCHDPEDCDYSKGGFFTTQKARRATQCDRKMTHKV